MQRLPRCDCHLLPVYLKTSLPLPLFVPLRLQSPFPSISHNYLTPSPFPSLCLSLFPSPHHLFSLPPVLPLLSPVSTAAENPAQTPACVCLYMCVCATTVDPRAKLIWSWAQKVRFNTHLHVCVKRSDQNIDCRCVTSQPCKQNPLKSWE